MWPSVARRITAMSPTPASSHTASAPAVADDLAATPGAVHAPRAVGGAPTPRRWRLAPPTQREITLLPLLALCHGFSYHAPNWQENGRYDLVRALVDDRTVSASPSDRPISR